ncbi:hypothetical protein [Streptomyces sp. st115]|uniref:hypothetical protein n=1 Tax=Streptomyces sp. st115 TaxID=1828047 RepID=UPI000BF0A3CD|nr:hypothetical protein [Streptomyces sp. st115]
MTGKGIMSDQGWDDETDRTRAQGWARFMTVIALVCLVGVIALGVGAVFGLKIFLYVVEALSG